jgi:thiol-disulfide isomerase/thioredoxin
MNLDYEAVKAQINAFGGETGNLSREFQVKQGDPNAIKEIDDKFAELDLRKLAYFEKLKRESPYFAQIFALNTYLSFANYGKKYDNEVDYFANEFFQLVNWSAPELEYLPWVYEALKSYTTTLSSIGLDAQTHKTFVENTLKKIPAESRTYQLALGGVLASLKEKSHANYGYFAKIFVDKYRSKSPEAAAQIEAELKRMGAFVVGGEAPDFTMNQVDGTPLSLNSLRGKVLLVDFWASWCGPCRRENPHVVALYQKYKDKGFEILGVSLDKTQENWVNAIQSDGLIWKHVSDLKGWGNEVAKMYGISSIPHTILLDKQGKILARGLRSAQLEQELHKIFGE